MIKQYPIMQDGMPAGTATLKQQGMFWLIRGRCTTEIQNPMKIILSTENDKKDLGICVSNPDGYGLDTRVPLKYLISEDITFEMEPVRKERFVHLSEDQPFTALNELRYGRFAVRNGKKGVIFPD